MAALLLTTFQRLEEAEIHYCLLRDTDQIHRLDELDEVDLLVDKQQGKQLYQLLAQLGFVALPSWGHGPHQFFTIYDEAGDRWLKLDVVTEVVFGYPYHTIVTNFAATCLARRQWHSGVFVPSVECEALTLLYHCIIDKKRFEPHRRQRLQTLCSAVKDRNELTTFLQQWGQPTLTWSQIATLVAREDWEGLLALRPVLTQALTQKQWLAQRTRPIQQRVVRKLSKQLQARRPPAISVAILAPDGAGKSTVVAGIQKSFCFPVYTTYMGLYQKGERRGLTKVLAKAGFVGRLAIQWQRYLKARTQQARRKLVIFDRYAYDALLPSPKPLTRLQQWRRQILAHACPAPDLVILLDAPGALLYARKGEHSTALLEEQRQGYLKLKSKLRQMVVVDATQNPDAVRRRVITHIWRAYVRRQTGLRSDVLAEKVMFDLCAQE